MGPMTTTPAPPPSGTEADGGVKAVLHWYLKRSRQTLRWKLEGLTERQLRMPMTPTGTNLVGLLKHVSSVEVGYFTECMGRSLPVGVPWMAEDAAPNADMFATEDESVDSILEFADRCAEAADAAIQELELDSPGRVPWWGRPEVTLARLLVHVVEEYARHVGHADLVRELIDGQAGHTTVHSNLPGEADGVDAQWWADYTARLRQIAERCEPGPEATEKVGPAVTGPAGEAVIRVSAVVVRRADGRVLTVRKAGTGMFMFPGGKPDDDESALQTALRELREEMGLVVGPSDLRHLGAWETAAANEPGHLLRAEVFELAAGQAGTLAPVPTAEIEQLCWMDPARPQAPDGHQVAPLLREVLAHLTA